MAEIGTPFGFVNPERDRKPPFATSYPPRARALRRRRTAFFSRFRQLPAELRSEIMKISIQSTREHRKAWFDKRGNPLVVQSRRGILHAQLQDKKPPSLAQLACVSTEWQVEVEKQLFRTLDLWVMPDSGPNEYADIITFSAIVTGPRRRYLKVLRLESYREYPTYQTPGSKDAKFHRTGGSYGCIVRLLRTLGTWELAEVADDLLVVELDIDLQDFPLQHLREEIEQLPKITSIGSLGVTMETEAFSKLPLALLCLLRKLPRLRSTHLRLSPWCFSSDDNRDHHFMELMRGFRTETPQLTELEMTHPFLGSQTKWSKGILVGMLTGPPITAFRHASYHLKKLVLGGPLDLPLFFRAFDPQHPNGNLVPEAQHSWPHLEVLIFRGSIVKESSPLNWPMKDEFLKLVGRTARKMPRLSCAIIMVESEWEHGFEGAGMSIGFLGARFSKKLSKVNLKRRGTNKRPVLTVAMHTPSRSAVRVWKDSIEYTNHMGLLIEFKPLPTFDENGDLVFHQWQDWKD